MQENAGSMTNLSPNVKRFQQYLRAVRQACTQIEAEGDTERTQEILDRSLDRLFSFTDRNDLSELGFDSVQAQNAIDDLSKARQRASRSRVAAIEDLMAALSAGHKDISVVDDLTEENQIAVANRIVDPGPRITPEENKKHVVLIEDDIELAQSISSQLDPYGYRCTVFHDLDKVGAHLDEKMPGIALVDIRLAGDDMAGANFMSARAKSSAYMPEVVFINASDDFDARLTATRSGAHAYLTEPFDLAELLDILDDLSAPADPEPFRALIVDDDVLVLKLYSRTLINAGIQVESISNPSQVLEALRDFRPDILVTDLSMPQCSGIELASVVRQLPAHVGMPIVFLSGETSVARQFNALHKGGDVFLTKPISPDHLVRTVTTRAERARTVRRFMYEDGLTGLLNHSALKETLAQELARAARADAPLSFALMDLDHFKRVNDTYGHPTGDRVLKAFARMVKKRLRISDVIGRYGGEEFAVIMPDTQLADALNVLNEVRETFAEITHICDNNEFTVTLSCGVSGFDGEADVATVIDAADQAAYQAKRQGRNQVVAAG